MLLFINNTLKIKSAYALYFLQMYLIYFLPGVHVSYGMFISICSPLKPLVLQIPPNLSHVAFIPHVSNLVLFLLYN